MELATRPRTPLTPTPIVRNHLLPSPTWSGSSSATVVDETVVPPLKYAQTPSNKIEEVFKVHDLLVKDGTVSRDFPFTNIVSVGGQSAGKSTVLSMVAGIPLYSATKTATVSPLQIHSRHLPGQLFEASIEIESSGHFVGKVVRVPFNSVPIQKDDLALATRMAGYEARRCGDDLSQLRTYEELKAIDPSHLESWLEAEKNKRWWTETLVILYVSGPAQANVSIIDLPGLMGGDNGKLTQALIEAEINAETRAHNLIMLCAPAGGSDLSPDDPLFTLVRKHDPTGSRTIGLFTKADNIDHASSVEDIVLGRDETWTGWKPAHGWWPISAKTHHENAMKMDERLIRQREMNLFLDAGKGWPELQRQAGVKFGTMHVRAKLYGVFEQMVMKRVVHDLQFSIDNHLNKHVLALSLLPPEETDPIGTLHDTIRDFHNGLKSVLVKQHIHSKLLYDVQAKLCVTLSSTLPVFLPFFEQDNTAAETYESPCLQGWSGTDSPNYVYLNEVFLAVQQSVVDFDRDEVRMLFIKRFAGVWRELCEKQVDAVWVEVNKGIAATLDVVCPGRNMLRSRFTQLLLEKQQHYKDETIKFVFRLCKRELQDPGLIDIADQQAKIDYMTALRHFDIFFTRTFDVDLVTTLSTTDHLASIATGEPFDERNSSKTERLAPAASASTSVFDMMTKEERKRCFTIMASVTTWLVRGVMRLSDTIGREAQAQVIDFIGDMVPALRKGLGLEMVVPDVFEAGSRLLGPSAEVVEKRENLRKRRNDLEEMRKRFKAVFEEA